MKHKTPLNGTSTGTTPAKSTGVKQGALVIPGPKFPLGRVVMTPAAMQVLTPDDVITALRRHVTGDWGDVCQEDWDENLLSLREGFRLFSVYHTQSGTKHWVITEHDRSVTTVLLPEDY